MEHVSGGGGFCGRCREPVKVDEGWGDVLPGLGVNEYYEITID